MRAMIAAVTRPSSEMRLDIHRAREAMARKGIRSVSELSRRLGNVDTSTVNRWFTGGTTPMGDNLTRLAHVLGVSIPWLMGAEMSATRASIVLQVREQLTEADQCPEADIIEAMGGLTVEQRAALRGAILGLLPALRGIAPMPTPHDEPPPPTEDSVASKLRTRSQRRKT
jgi:transcriptional regulator with XRE-family HTH domain